MSEFLIGLGIAMSSASLVAVVGLLWSHEKMLTRHETHFDTLRGRGVL